MININFSTDQENYVHGSGSCLRVLIDGHVLTITSGDNDLVMRRMSTEVGIHIHRIEPVMELIVNLLTKAHRDAKLKSIVLSILCLRTIVKYVI